MLTHRDGDVMPTLTRTMVNLPAGIEQAFRTQIVNQYGDKIPEIRDAPTGHLIRFVVLIQMGCTPEQAKRGLRGLSRGNTRSDLIKNE